MNAVGCRIRHEPGSAAQRRCPVHGVREAVRAVVPPPAAGPRAADVGRLDADEREALARDVDAPAPALEQLACDTSRFVRAGVAANPSASPGLLETLAQDRSGSVRAGVAANPSASPGLLEMLAHDKYWAVHWYVAGNPSAPPRVLDALARTESGRLSTEAIERLRELLCERFGLSPDNVGAIEMLRDLPWWELTRDDPQVQLTLVLHPNEA